MNCGRAEGSRGCLSLSPLSLTARALLRRCCLGRRRWRARGQGDDAEDTDKTVVTIGILAVCVFLSAFLSVPVWERIAAKVTTCLARCPRGRDPSRYDPARATPAGTE